MKRHLIVLFVVLAVVAGLARSGPQEGPELVSDRCTVFRFEDDEGNYNDDYAEPGIGYLELRVGRASSGEWTIYDLDGIPHVCDSAEEVLRIAKASLTPNLTSYDPATGTIQDEGHHGELGGDQFVNFDSRYRANKPCFLDDVKAL